MNFKQLELQISRSFHQMKSTLLALIFLLSLSVAAAQSKKCKWVVGVSGSYVGFENNSLGEHYNSQFPKINLTRYLFSGLSFGASITISGLGDVESLFSNHFSYNSFDGYLRYDFNLSDNNFVPYLVLGRSLIGAPETIENSEKTLTSNLAFGSTFWVTNHWGLNGQIMYKISPEKYNSMVNHQQLTVGLVYSFRARVLVRRVWDRSRTRK